MPEIIYDKGGIDALIAGSSRVLIEDAGTYPARPAGDSPVLFIGTTNPDGLGLMLEGDVWVNSTAETGGGTGGPITSADVTDFAEAVRDAVAAALVQGANITITPDDAGDTITISSSGGGSTDPEVVRDVVAAMLVQGTNVTITPDDAGDTITISAAGGGGGGELTLESILGGPDPFWPISGETRIPPGLDFSSEQFNMNLDRLYLLAFRPAKACSVSQLTLRTAAGSTGATVRFGIYDTNADYIATGLPLFDVVVDASGMGYVSAEGLSVALDPNVTYVAAMVGQGASPGAQMAGILPGRAWFSSRGAPVYKDPSGYILPYGKILDGVSGALPDLTSATLTPLIGKAPICAISIA